MTFTLAACQVSTVDRPPPTITDLPTPETSQRIIQETVSVPENTTGDVQPITVYTNLWDRIGAGLSLYEEFSHPSIDNEMRWYVDNQKYFDRIAGRAAPFLFWIVEEIESRDLPLELALVPIVESAYNPRAYSKEHAAGLWQFMGPTARSYGLKKDWWYDGRRDPLASTNAALDYLEMLHTQFDGDWLLALAAYNAGEGTIRRAVRRNTRANKPTDFWELPLPRETKGHVPRILAIAKLIANAPSYGIELPEIANEAYLDIVELNFQVDLDRAAYAASLEPEVLRALNPGYLQWATHPDTPQWLVVPKSTADAFRQAVADIPAAQRVTWDRYEIRSGDTLGGIARAFNTKINILRQVNNLAGSRIIAGRSIIIPRSSNLQQLALPVTAFQGNSINQDQAPTSYRVRHGDNLWSIARRYGLRSSEIAHGNNISLDSLLHPGQILTLNPPEYIAALDTNKIGSPLKISYRVEKGDSLAKIAGKLGVSVDSIVGWNGLNRQALIFPGQ
ncbi:MAG: LysM peptidoglycan-binding domain-containing protein, partial [Gammaproteobacteria bacterium]|nr:LysM peptidoglycan-binding domain-containing protein [Gammaproteobacteria bacterium]